MTAGIVAIKADTTVALNAPVHLMVEKRSEVLILVSAFFVPEPPVRMASHHCHVLKMARAAFIAHSTIVRMIGH